MDGQQPSLWLKYVDASSISVNTLAHQTTPPLMLEGSDIVIGTVSGEQVEQMSVGEAELHSPLTSLSENEVETQGSEITVPLVTISEPKTSQQSILKRPTRSLLTHNRSKGFRKIVVYPRRQQSEDEHTRGEYGVSLPDAASAANAVTVYRTEADLGSAMAIISSAATDVDPTRVQTDQAQSDPSFSISVAGVESGDAVLSAMVGDEFTSEDDFLTVVNPVSGSVTMMPFKDLFEDKNNTLMTPQELESMPENGIEFEESVGPKEAQADEMSLMELVGDSGEKLLGKARNRVAVCRKNASTKAPNYTLGKVLVKTDNATKITQIVINPDQLQKIHQLICSTTSADVSGKTLELKPANGELLDGVITDKQEVMVSPADAALMVATMEKESELGDVANGHLLSVEESDHQATTTCSRELYIVTEDGKRLMLRFNPDPSDQCDTEPVSKKRFVCPLPDCRKVFTKDNKFRIHMTSHSYDRPHKCTVDGCDWSFPSQYKLRRHLECHKGTKLYVCDIGGCSRTFTTVYNLNAHKRLHYRPCLNECPLGTCRQRFPTKKQLDLHLKEHEDDVERPYQCPEPGCDRGFYCSNSLASHLRSHNSRMPKICPVEGCGKEFDKECRLKQHLRSHTGERPYICGEEGCGWSFTSASKLTRHMKSHSQERNYLCPHENCTKRFMRAEHLKAHVNTHTGERPFVCRFEQCQARFTARQSLYAHLKKHSAADLHYRVVYHCPVDGCDKKYSTQSSLKVHVSKLHSEVDIQQLDFLAYVSTEEMPTLENLTQLSQEDEGIQTNGENILEDVKPTVANITSATQFITETASTSPSPGLQEMSTQLVGNNVVTQFVVPADLTESHLTSIGHQTTAFTEIDSTGETLLPLREGSARTDVLATTILCDRVRRRRKRPLSISSDSSVTTSDIVLPPPSISFQTQLLQDDPPLLTPCDILVEGALPPSSTTQSVLALGAVGSQVDVASTREIVSQSQPLDIVISQSALCVVSSASRTLSPELLMANDLGSSLSTSILNENASDFTGSSINLIQELDVE
ncbi:PREDICTED: uncharacterized protein LOC106807703 [Priapulus caudatus]|uniref:Uncharacterized protein LOC106807703 n=1 Tax=Priapulus caudatus TaxID=37621 RepID=A0ABM1E098_PRICU|nr:PREDICTED: uncharacterized protein LOC106807703 [Priapulus caudatus]XP_014665621.1 PREDICTED: uncharacterized protein LOC106807703 [Priapulus caudatus]